MMEKTIFVVGAGKGLGNAVARKFGENGYRVVLMCRSQEHLDAYKQEMEQEGFSVETQAVDVTDPKGLADVMERCKEMYGVPDVLFYNVGITVADGEVIGGMTAEVMKQRYETDVLGAYICMQHILGEEFSRKNGAVLITGGGLSMYPSGDYLPLSMDKAALRAMVLALHPVYEKQGVFLGSVQVCNTIGGSEKYMPDRIAEEFWKLYQERKDAEVVY